MAMKMAKKPKAAKRVAIVRETHEKLIAIVRRGPWHPHTSGADPEAVRLTGQALTDLRRLGSWALDHATWTDFCCRRLEMSARMAKVHLDHHEYHLALDEWRRTRDRMKWEVASRDASGQPTAYTCGDYRVAYDATSAPYTWQYSVAGCIRTWSKTLQASQYDAAKEQTHRRRADRADRAKKFTPGLYRG